jgi:DNA-binding NtrC family response regulator
VLIGNSPAVQHLRAQVRRVGPYFRTALLTGEAGCGDEAIARSLHELSPAADRPFAVLSADRAEQRFGSAEGPVPAATEGTLYFPAIASLSRSAQQRLLQLIRTRNPSTPHLIAYAPGGLRPLIGAGSFSPELAAALGAVRIALPPLRERVGDMPFLLQHLLKAELPPDRHRPIYLTEAFTEAAARFHWPGNLAQLEAALHWLAEGAHGGSLNPADLHSALEAIASSERNLPPQVRLVRLEVVMHEHIRSVLVACNGNKLRAAEILGISRSTLYRMLDAQGIPDSLALAG